jgi:transposase
MSCCVHPIYRPMKPLCRCRCTMAKFLKGWTGILQTDGYQAYDQVGGPGLIHVGCWAHARRKFVDAVKVNPQDSAAVAMVTRMDALFLVDREARRQQLNAEQCAALRREHSQIWVDEIHAECLKLRSAVLPKSTVGEAVNYTLNMWAKLRRCFDHAEVELSNNIAENSMRPVAVGRKNWLHVGSAKSGSKVAAILSVVESCRRLGLPVKDYLWAVLPGMSRRKHSEAAHLTPARWTGPSAT